MSRFEISFRVIQFIILLSGIEGVTVRGGDDPVVPPLLRRQGPERTSPDHDIRIGNTSLLEEDADANGSIAPTDMVDATTVTDDSSDEQIDNQISADDLGSDEFSPLSLVQHSDFANCIAKNVLTTLNDIQSDFYSPSDTWKVTHMWDQEKPSTYHAMLCFAYAPKAAASGLVKEGSSEIELESSAESAEDNSDSNHKPKNHKANKHNSGSHDDDIEVSAIQQKSGQKGPRPRHYLFVARFDSYIQNTFLGKDGKTVEDISGDEIEPDRKECWDVTGTAKTLGNTEVVSEKTEPVFSYTFSMNDVLSEQQRVALEVRVANSSRTTLAEKAAELQRYQDLCQQSVAAEGTSLSESAKRLSIVPTPPNTSKRKSYKKQRFLHELEQKKVNGNSVYDGHKKTYEEFHESGFPVLVGQDYDNPNHLYNSHIPRLLRRSRNNYYKDMVDRQVEEYVTENPPPKDIAEMMHGNPIDSSTFLDSARGKWYFGFTNAGKWYFGFTNAQLPREYSWVHEYYDCRGPVIDQGRCGSCYAVSTMTAGNNRRCMAEENCEALYSEKDCIGGPRISKDGFPMAQGCHWDSSKLRCTFKNAEVDKLLLSRLRSASAKTSLLMKNETSSFIQEEHGLLYPDDRHYHSNDDGSYTSLETIANVLEKFQKRNKLTGRSMMVADHHGDLNSELVHNFDSELENEFETTMSGIRNAKHTEISPDATLSMLEEQPVQQGNLADDMSIEDPLACAPPEVFDETPYFSKRDSDADARLHCASLKTSGCSGCAGGHEYMCYIYSHIYGVSPLSCVPNREYKGSALDHMESASGEVQSCPAVLEQSKNCDRLFTSLPYRLQGEISMMRAIYEDGPVVASFSTKGNNGGVALEDFFAYNSGKEGTLAQPSFCYEELCVEQFDDGSCKTRRSDKCIFRNRQCGPYRQEEACNTGKPQNVHSVVLVGWGEELTRYETKKTPAEEFTVVRNKTRYWWGRNSWGAGWGIYMPRLAEKTKGYFKIEKGYNLQNIEEYVTGSFPDRYRMPQRHGLCLRVMDATDPSKGCEVQNMCETGVTGEIKGAKTGCVYQISTDSDQNWKPLEVKHVTGLKFCVVAGEVKWDGWKIKKVETASSDSGTIPAKLTWSSEKTNSGSETVDLPEGLKECAKENESCVCQGNAYFGPSDEDQNQYWTIKAAGPVTCARSTFDAGVGRLSEQPRSCVCDGPTTEKQTSEVRDECFSAFIATDDLAQGKCKMDWIAVMMILFSVSLAIEGTFIYFQPDLSPFAAITSCCKRNKRPEEGDWKPDPPVEDEWGKVHHGIIHEKLDEPEEDEKPDAPVEQAAS